MSISSQNLYNTTGIQLPEGAFVVIVRTEWNDDIVSKLEEGCIRILNDHKVAYKIITVPGAFEIPFAIRAYCANVVSFGAENWIASGRKPIAFIALGCVLRGGTPHFEYVCNAVTDGIVQLNLQLTSPVIFGVLTLDTQEQADERTGGKHGHKGEEAAVTALKMIALSYSFTKK